MRPPKRRVLAGILVAGALAAENRTSTCICDCGRAAGLQIGCATPQPDITPRGAACKQQKASSVFTSGVQLRWRRWSSVVICEAALVNTPCRHAPAGPPAPLAMTSVSPVWCRQETGLQLQEKLVRVCTRRGPAWPQVWHDMKSHSPS
jgi:hypothetical protein